MTLGYKGLYKDENENIHLVIRLRSEINELKLALQCVSYLFPSITLLGQSRVLSRLA